MLYGLWKKNREIPSPPVAMHTRKKWQNPWDWRTKNGHRNFLYRDGQFLVSALIVLLYLPWNEEKASLDEWRVISLSEKEIPSAVIARLPRYYRYLRELLDAGVERISFNELGKKCI